MSRLGDTCWCHVNAPEHEDFLPAHRLASNCTVDCDDHCGALLLPLTMDDFRKALDHWRHHSYLSGCSHGS